MKGKIRRMQANKNIISLLIGVILLSSVTNWMGNIGNISNIFYAFQASLLGTIAGVSVFFLRIKLPLYFTWMDIFVCIVILGCGILSFSTSSLWMMTSMALFLIYWIVRLASSLNYVIIFGGVLISIFILAFTGYLQYAGILLVNNPYFHVTGPYKNPAIYGVMICLLASILLTWCLHPIFRKRYKMLYRFTLVLCMACLPIFIGIGCRAAWIALVVVLIRCIYLFYFRNVRFLSVFHFHAIGGILITFLITIFAYGFYQLRPDSVQGRILIWKVTWRMIEEKPFTGFGLDGFASHYMYYQASYLKTEGTEKEKTLADSNHLVYNEPLRLVVEYGVLGLLLYISFFILVMIIPRRKDIITLSVQSFFIVYLIWGLFAYPNEVIQMHIILVVALACLSSRYRKVTLSFLPSNYIGKAVCGTMLVITVTLTFTLTEKYKSYQKFYRIMNNYSSNEMKGAIKELAVIEKEMQNEPAYWIYYCMILDKMKLDSLLLSKISRCEVLYPAPNTYIIKGELLQRQHQYDKAEEAYLLANWMVPSRQRARSRLALLYKIQGREIEARCMAKQILTEKVKVYGFETYKIHEELKRIFENQVP